jgi:hypothetical protein
MDVLQRRGVRVPQDVSSSVSTTCRGGMPHPLNDRAAGGLLATRCRRWSWRGWRGAAGGCLQARDRGEHRLPPGGVLPRVTCPGGVGATGLKAARHTGSAAGWCRPGVRRCDADHRRLQVRDVGSSTVTPGGARFRRPVQQAVVQGWVRPRTARRFPAVGRRSCNGSAGCGRLLMPLGGGDPTELRDALRASATRGRGRPSPPRPWPRARSPARR